MELDTLRDGAHDLLGDMVALRRTLHQWPEIGNDLPITREKADWTTHPNNPGRRSA